MIVSFDLSSSELHARKFGIFYRSVVLHSASYIIRKLMSKILLFDDIRKYNHTVSITNSKNKFHPGSRYL